ncbi:MAG: cell division protein FtsQ/DivIB, partial [Pseudomonadota bacterium]|nr:cell division protein FtsQ/DivIB [Pseudomonadota bacterium]
MSAGARIVGITLAVAVIALPVVAVVKGWVGAERFPLDKLRITSEFRHIDGSELQTILAPYAAQGFFAVRLADAQRAVETLPWVDQAEVSKKWPDVLEVRIVEHRPFALWDEEMLLSDHGKLYPRAVMGDALPPGLPQLGGNPHQIEAVVRQYNEAKQAFAAAGFDVRGLRQDARGSWSLELSSGTEVVVGRSDAEARIRRFARLLPQLIPPPGKALARADLRYANGFALK